MYFKFGFNREDWKNLLLVKGDSLVLGGRTKFLEKFRLASGPYFCLMCGCVNENLFHFGSKCEELSVVLEEYLGVSVG